MWQTAALVAQADKLPPEVLDILKQPLFPPPEAPAPANPGESNSNPNPVPPGAAHGAAPGSGITPKNVRPMTGAHTPKTPQ